MSVKTVDMLGSNIGVGDCYSKFFRLFSRKLNVGDGLLKWLFATPTNQDITNVNGKLNKIVKENSQIKSDLDLDQFFTIMSKPVDFGKIMKNKESQSKKVSFKSH